MLTSARAWAMPAIVFLVQSKIESDLFNAIVRRNVTMAFFFSSDLTWIQKRMSHNCEYCDIFLLSV